MTRIEPLSVATVVGLFNVHSAYFFSFAWLFGQIVWSSFFAGFIAHKALSRPQFTTLQAKTFPVYFATALGNSLLLLALWVSNNPKILDHLSEPSVPAVAQAWTLIIINLLGVANWAWIGPRTGSLSLQRQRLEKAEGKPYNDPTVSDELKALNKQFGTMHGLSSLANLTTVILLGFHGLWIANVGLRKEW